MSRIKTDIKLDNNSTGKIQMLKNTKNGFMEFMNKYSIITMAIGIIIGQTTKDTVNTLVTGIITPAIQLLMPNIELQDLVVTAGKAEFQVGLFLNSFIEMLIIMAILYLTFAVVLKKADLLDKKSSKSKKKKPKTK